MFTYNYRNRFDINQLQNNVLMTQIRAQKNVYSSKNTQPISSHREEGYRNGKRIYNEILYRPSLSPSVKENRGYNALSRQRGRNMLRQTVNMPQQRSRSGRKRIDTSYKKQLAVRASVQRSPQNGRRRLDHSPNHQHFNTTINLRWN